MRKSTPQYPEFRQGSLHLASSRHNLLLKMAKEAEQLAAQALRLKELRAQKRVSQETAAYEIGVSARGYRNWERGTGGIDDKNIKRVADYFETTPDFIEYGEERRAPDLMAELSPRDFAAQLDRIEDGIRDLVERLVALEVLQAVQTDTAPKRQPAPAKRPRRAA